MMAANRLGWTETEHKIQDLIITRKYSEDSSVLVLDRAPRACEMVTEMSRAMMAAGLQGRDSEMAAAA